MTDLSVIYTTANVISEKFRDNVYTRMLNAIDDAELIIVSKKPMMSLKAKQNLVFAGERSHINIYRETLEGVKQATTKYIALAEDDVLYHEEHFKYRPKKRAFAYNSNTWSIYTWVKPAIFSYKGVRRNNCGLICERDLYIETMEERFAKFSGIPDEYINLSHWAEPGRYEGNMGLTIRDTELFATNPPNIMFSHETGLSFANLGKRKRLGDVRATVIPYWGAAEDILQLYYE